MSRKHKISSELKKHRRIIEIQRAQNEGLYARPSTPSYVLKAVDVGSQRVDVKKSDTFYLPIADIKADLIKNILFAVFSVVVLLTLKQTSFGLTYFTQLFAR